MQLHAAPASAWHRNSLPRQSRGQTRATRATPCRACSCHSRAVSRIAAAAQPATGGKAHSTAPDAWQRCAASLAAATAAAAFVTGGSASAVEMQALAHMPLTQHTVSAPQHSRADEASPASATPAAQHRSTAAALQDLPLANFGLPRLDDLPRPDKPFQLLGYLLKHPVAALAVGGGLAWGVPRLVRAGIRYVVVPAIALLLLYLAARNPSFVLDTASGAVSAVAAHPIATSAAILVGSGLMLSPYILAAGLALLLVTGTQLLPGFMRPALPGPVSEALHQVDILQGHTKTALERLGAAVRPAPSLKDGNRK